MLDYNHIIKIAIHEVIHHYQWKHDPEFKRVKGVMHNVKFKRLEDHYINLAYKLGVIKNATNFMEETNADSIQC